MKTETETYILRHNVNNDILFKRGTIIRITDDYWGDNLDDKNTGFTVVSGKLKGKKGYVANGLKGWLLENTKENRQKVSNYIKAKKDIQKQLDRLDRDFDLIKTAVLQS